MIIGFLLGFIAMGSAVAGMFFLRFWKETHDTFFLGFAAFFWIEAANRVAIIFLTRPNEGSPWIYCARLAGLLFLLAAILKKNYGRER